MTKAREVVGPLNIGASIVQKLVEAVEDAGGGELDLLNVLLQFKPELGLKPVGEYIFERSNTFHVPCTQGCQSPKNFAREIGLDTGGIAVVFDECLQNVEYPSEDFVDIQLVHPNKELSMTEAEEYLKEYRLRPATLIEILYLIKHFKNFVYHKCNPLFVLGERRMLADGREFIVVLSANCLGAYFLTQYPRNEKLRKDLFWAGVKIDKQ